MDLRRRLVIQLALALACLLGIFMLVWLHDAREDALAEQAAALRLVDLINAASQIPESPEAAQALLAQSQLRHLQAQLDPPQKAGPASQVVGWPDLSSLSATPRELSWGGQRLVLAPDPHSEWREQLSASAHVMGLLLVFGGLCLLMTWRAVDQALRPVREIETALQHLQTGTAPARLPDFALREFQSIGRGIDALAQSLQQSRQQQQQLTSALMEVQDKERQQLAAELHDEFGQSLTAISATAAYIERHAESADASALSECAREISQESRRISGHVRHMLSQLKPYGLNEEGTADALRELVCSWQVRLPDMHLAADIARLPPLPSDCALALYRCLQEALTNCVRHSQASRIQVMCGVQDAEVVLVVLDDGIGHAHDLMQGQGHGLLGLRERLRRAGGQLQLQDNPSGGIVLSARIPLMRDAS